LRSHKSNVGGVESELVAVPLDFFPADPEAGPGFVLRQDGDERAFAIVQVVRVGERSGIPLVDFDAAIATQS